MALLSEVYNFWGLEVVIDNQVTANTKIRIYGIILSSQFHHELNILIDTRVSIVRNLDSYYSDKSAVYQNLTLLICNSGIVIPTRLEKALEHKRLYIYIYILNAMTNSINLILMIKLYL